jgi:hypothetical protein
VACSHPFGVEAIRNDAGEVVGGRCPACKRVAYKGDSWWVTVKRAFFGYRGSPDVGKS